MMALRMQSTLFCFALHVINYRRDLLTRNSVVPRPFVQVITLWNKLLLQLLFYGDKDLPSDMSKHVLELTLEFIHKTGRSDFFVLFWTVRHAVQNFIQFVAKITLTPL